MEGSAIIVGSAGHAVQPHTSHAAAAIVTVNAAARRSRVPSKATALDRHWLTGGGAADFACDGNKGATNM